MVQYNAALVITGVIEGTSRYCIYKELDLESLAEWRWSCKIFFFHKIINGILPVYLQSCISYSLSNKISKLKEPWTILYKNKNI